MRHRARSPGEQVSRPRRHRPPTTSGRSLIEAYNELKAALGDGGSEMNALIIVFAVIVLLAGQVSAQTGRPGPFFLRPPELSGDGAGCTPPNCTPPNPPGQPPDSSTGTIHGTRPADSLTDRSRGAQTPDSSPAQRGNDEGQLLWSPQPISKREAGRTQFWGKNTTQALRRWRHENGPWYSLANGQNGEAGRHGVHSAG